MRVLSKMTEKSGILGVCFNDGTKTRFSFPTTASEPDKVFRQKMLHQLVVLLQNTLSEEIKATMGPLTAIARRQEKFILVVIVQKGHDVVKSLQRMMRRSFDHLVSTAPEPQKIPGLKEELTSSPVKTTPAPAKPSGVVFANPPGISVSPTVTKHEPTLPDPPPYRRGSEDDDIPDPSSW